MGAAVARLLQAPAAVEQAGVAVPAMPASAGWGPARRDAPGNIPLGVGAVAGGVFGLHTYRKAMRRREAEWLDRRFERLYLDPVSSPVLLSFEYDFAGSTGRLVDRVLTVDTPVLGQADIDRIRNVDVVLNCLEHLLYLDSDKHLLAQDRDAMFGYWLGLLSQPRYASLRQYALQFGYEHVAAYCSARKVEHVLMYGSLMRGHEAHARFGLDEALEFVGEARIPGSVYRVADYPGFKFGEGEAHCELFRIRDPSVLAKLDEYEEYFPQDMARSEYARRVVHAADAGVDAWIYEYLPAVEGRSRVAGRWSTAAG